MLQKHSLTKSRTLEHNKPEHVIFQKCIPPVACHGKCRKNNYIITLEIFKRKIDQFLCTSPNRQLEWRMDTLIQVPEWLHFLDVTPVQQLMSPLAHVVADLSDKSGLPVDKVNFLLVFLLSYPLAIVHRYIYNPTLRHIYSAVFGILTVIYMVGNDFYHSLFSAVVAYILLFTLRNPFGTKLIWGWAFGMLQFSKQKYPRQNKSDNLNLFIFKFN
jgi:hypothetical protein